MKFSEKFYNLPAKFYLKLSYNSDYIYIDISDPNHFPFRDYGDKTIKSITSLNGLLVYTLN